MRQAEGLGSQCRRQAQSAGATSRRRRRPHLRCAAGGPRGRLNPAAPVASALATTTAASSSLSSSNCHRSSTLRALTFARCSALLMPPPRPPTAAAEARADDGHPYISFSSRCADELRRRVGRVFTEGRAAASRARKASRARARAGSAAVRMTGYARLFGAPWPPDAQRVRSVVPAARGNARSERHVRCAAWIQLCFFLRFGLLHRFGPWQGR